MNTIDVNQVLTQMRRLEGLAKNEVISVEQGQGADFGDLLKQSIDKVNETQQTAG